MKSFDSWVSLPFTQTFDILYLFQVHRLLHHRPLLHQVGLPFFLKKKKKRKIKLCSCPLIVSKAIKEPYPLISHPPNTLFPSFSLSLSLSLSRLVLRKVRGAQKQGFLRNKNNIQPYGIQNLVGRSPDFRTWDSEYTVWNPEYKTDTHYLTRSKAPP